MGATSSPLPLQCSYLSGMVGQSARHTRCPRSLPPHSPLAGLGLPCWLPGVRAAAAQASGQCCGQAGSRAAWARLGLAHPIIFLCPIPAEFSCTTCPGKAWCGVAWVAAQLGTVCGSTGARHGQAGSAGWPACCCSSRR